MAARRSIDGSHLHLAMGDVVEESGLLVEGARDQSLAPPLVHSEEAAGVLRPVLAHVEPLQQLELGLAQPHPQPAVAGVQLAHALGGAAQARRAALAAVRLLCETQIPDRLFVIQPG